MSIETIYANKKHESYFSTARKEIIPLLPQGAKRILEIGCGEGATLAYLKDTGLADWTCGADIHESALQQARAMGVDATIHCNIEELSNLDQGPKFDVILCLDILEHLIDPWSTVKRLSGALTHNGVIIASIPNVQNIRVIAPLIFGRWTYKDCGILDNGHLRFFTKKSAIELMESSGLRADRIIYNKEKHWLPRLVNTLTLGLFSRFITVQYLIRVRGCDESTQGH